jgi:hypothetical protein
LGLDRIQVIWYTIRELGNGLAQHAEKDRMMITAESFQKAQKTLNEAQGIADMEMPAAKLIFVGADNDYLYFNIVAKRQSVTDRQIKDIKEKTRFQMISEHNTKLIYQAEFKMNLWV